MSRTLRTVCSTVAAAGAVLLLAGCLPEPGPTAAPSSSAQPTSSASVSATPAPSPSESDIAFPAACEELYSPQMFDMLSADVAPLNDPGTTLMSTQIAPAMELLDGAQTTLRCSWGPPSERGLATNVTVVTPEQASRLASAFSEAGFASADHDEGTLLTLRQEMITMDDEVATMGETHFLRDDLWVSTRWINVDPEGYTEDIVASLWG